MSAGACPAIALPLFLPLSQTHFAVENHRNYYSGVQCSRVTGYEAVERIKNDKHLEI
jgi:hypothetical protein